jgi:outer membrane biosynthesis protein TonB
MKSHQEQEQELRAQVQQVRGRLQSLGADLRSVEDEVESLAPQRTQHELLEQACGSLEKLGEMGAGALFWGERADATRIDAQLREVRGRVDAFRARLGALDERRGTILAAIGHEEENLDNLGADLYQVREEEEQRKAEWVIERDISALQPRVQMLAWARGGEEDRRFRKTLAASLLVCVPLGLLLPMINLPLPRHITPAEMPRRIVQLLREEKAVPIPPPPVARPKPPEEKPQEQPETKPAPEPKQPEKPGPEGPEAETVAKARPNPTGKPDLPPGPAGPAFPGPEAQPSRVGKAGILAFRDKFVSLAQDKVAPRLGANARYGAADDTSRASSQARSMLTTNAPGSSGGINLASLSMGVGGGGGGAGALHGDGLGAGGGGGGGGGIQRVSVDSPIDSIGGGGRPLARGGPGPSRTDEEIQIVFDRYKAAFYRLYNRALRTDASLRGQMVLRLTIEPDGSVSMCKLQSSDMNAPDLADQVVGIVRTINFGAKEGVQALTILYPIDFLPAA